jgi:hypothetical protein
MGVQTWVETLVTSQAAGTLFNTYTTAKTVLNAQSVIVLPAGFFYIGRALRVVIIGGISNRVTGPDTTTFQIMLGSTGTIAAFTTGAMNLTTTAHTTIPFFCEVSLTCRAVGTGTSANLIGQAQVQGQMFAMAASLADNAAGTGYAMGPNTAPAVGTGFDSTIANVLDFWVAQSFSGAGNGIQVHQYKVFNMN